MITPPKGILMEKIYLSYFNSSSDFWIFKKDVQIVSKEKITIGSELAE